MENASIEEAAKILQNSQGVVQLRIRKDEHFNGMIPHRMIFVISSIYIRIFQSSVQSNRVPVFPESYGLLFRLQISPMKPMP